VSEATQDVVTEVAWLFWEGWFFMLGAGILHSTYHQVPAIGYWMGVAVSVFFAGGGASRLAILRRVKKLNGEKY
jgi:hypothetical protein